jgi:hypothetical protein
MKTNHIFAAILLSTLFTTMQGASLVIQKPPMERPQVSMSKSMSKSMSNMEKKPAKLSINFKNLAVKLAVHVILVGIISFIVLLLLDAFSDNEKNYEDFGLFVTHSVLFKGMFYLLSPFYIYNGIGYAIDDWLAPEDEAQEALLPNRNV